MIDVKNVSKEYKIKDIAEKSVSIEVVKNVTFTLEENKCYSLVGESGSGKSTLSRLLTYIEKPTKGEIWIDNKNITTLNKKQLRQMRSDVQMVLQDGKSALDPKQRIYDSIAEPIRNLTNIDKQNEREFIENLLEKVQLPMKTLDMLPGELSGGQQKRVCIARAMCVSPKFVVFDESVSGLDVIVRKKVLDLLLKLQEEYKSTYLFITHDMDAALYMSRNILVMKNGQILEKVSGLKSYNDFNHEYSISLLKSQFMKLENSECYKKAF
jgi:ABC-type glutathione transport system ATPase component